MCKSLIFGPPYSCNGRLNKKKCKSDAFNGWHNSISILVLLWKKHYLCIEATARGRELSATDTFQKGIVLSPSKSVAIAAFAVKIFRGAWLEFVTSWSHT